MRHAPLDLGDLDSHRALLSKTAQQLQEVQNIATKLAIEEAAARCTRALERVRESVFRVAVVGEFKRGKSTLINALLGQEILPADVLPCSATLNRVTYGLEPSVRVLFKPGADGRPREEVVAIDALSDYVTKLTDDSERRAADVEEAVVYFPTAYCRDKADIIDTPGLNDESAMTDITLSVLPSVDAVVLVILAQSPFSSYEADFLQRLMTHDLGRVIFVVNRMDALRKRDRPRVMAAVRSRIQRAMEARAEELFDKDSQDYHDLIAQLGAPRIFGLSGGDALDAKLDGDQEALERSGFPAFERALERFLSEERGQVSLTVLANAGVSSSVQILQHMRLRRDAIQLETSEFEEAYATNSARLERLRHDYRDERQRLRGAMRALVEKLTPQANAIPTLMCEEAALAIAAHPLHAKSIRKANLQATQDALAAAVSERLEKVVRREAERLNLQIEREMAAELDRLREFGSELGEQLQNIHFAFQGTARLNPTGTHDGVDALAGAVGSLGGAFFGGVFGGAFSGFNVAGIKGAAVGGAGGAVASTSTMIGLAITAGLLGLPATWPVTLPILAVSGVAGALGGKKLTMTVFSGEQVEKFREAYRDATIQRLERQSQQHASKIRAQLTTQIRDAFEAIERVVLEQEFKSAITTAQNTLDHIHTQRTRAVAQGELETEELDRLADRASHIAQQCQALLRALQTPRLPSHDSA